MFQTLKIRTRLERTNENRKNAGSEIPKTCVIKGNSIGGATQIRTGDKGFADLCLATWLWRHIILWSGRRDSEASASPRRGEPLGENPDFRDLWSGRRDSNPRPSPWQGDALPLSHFRMN